jgi:hypothetical protein
MDIKLKHLALANFLLLAIISLEALAAPPPTLKNCANSWRMTSASAALAFGAFSIDSGSGTISMSSSGALTVSGDIGLTSTLPVTTYNIQVDNRLGAACLGFPFSLDWVTAPAPLAPVGGIGTNMPLSVFVYEPLIAPTVGATFPINVPANSGLALPFTLTLYGDISTTFLQTGDDYVSPAFRVGLTMDTRLKRGPNATATATSIVPISLLEVLPMDFGTIAGGSSAGTVVLDTLGARTPGGVAQVIASGPGSAATFQLTGGAGLTYIVSFSASGTLESPGGQQMTVTTFTNNSLGTIPAGGIESFQVGGTLNLNPAQPAGVYSTTTGGGSPYTMTVNYN